MVQEKDYSTYYTVEELRRNRDNNINDFIVRKIEPGQTVLDCGAGLGITAKKLKDKGCKVTCIDIKPNYVDEMRKLGLKAEIGDIRKLPFKDKEFDVAMAEEVIEHLDNPGAGIKELCRVAHKVLYTMPKSNGEPWHLWHIHVESAASSNLFTLEETGK